MKYPVLRCAVAALLLSGVPLAHAVEDYWYAGLGVGYSWVQFYPADFSSGGTFQDSKKDFDAGFKGLIGYQINRNWAAEVSYATVGKFHYKYNNGSITQDAVYKVTGVGFSAVPTVPLTKNFSLYGRLGTFFSTARLTFYNANFVAGAPSAGVQTSQPSVLTGFGAQYFFDEESGIRIEYENFGTVGNACSLSQACTGRANAKMASASLIVKF
jgi:OOP family OmpA-OmpF porin